MISLSKFNFKIIPFLSTVRDFRTCNFCTGYRLRTLLGLREKEVLVTWFYDFYFVVLFLSVEICDSPIPCYQST